MFQGQGGEQHAGLVCPVQGPSAEDDTSPYWLQQRTAQGSAQCLLGAGGPLAVGLRVQLCPPQCT